ncbi:MAG TPA: cupin domain-containing protein, partial [Burkholderiales bacterium]|nr:cupin domain-containing protein [Burkholderiales bacterium]
MHDRLPGGMRAGKFLEQYWQRKPLLVRGALEDLAEWRGNRRLFALAARSDVESRLVSRRGPQWSVQRGPIARRVIVEQRPRGWTLLVHGVNLHSARSEALLRRFAFLPQARMDDVMVSYAAPQGSVGAHYDEYDVFLIQGPGRRVWRLQRPRRFAEVPDAPLRLIADFSPEEEYLLEEGDLLYLPPRWGHEGVALEPSWTYSIGFRAPREAEIAAALLDALHERGFRNRIYRDPLLRPERASARIGTALVRFATKAVAQIRWTRDDVLRSLGRHLTAPKHHVVFALPSRPLALRAFRTALARRTAVLDPRSQLLYRGRRFFLNGEELVVPRRQSVVLSRFADRRRLDGRRLAASG